MEITPVLPRLDIELDDWQKKVLETEGNVLLFSGRRVGKSEILVIDAGEYAANHSNKSILVISHTERQAYWLFEKMIAYFGRYYPKLLGKGGKHKPTKSQVLLKNGTIIRCLPTGLTGSGLRGIPADRIYPDELDYIEEAVWSAVTPMLLTTGGVIRGGTTPNPLKVLANSYVYNHMEKNPNFTVFNISTEDVIRNRPISKTWTAEQRKAAIDHLESEKKTMSKKAWMVEYMGQRVESTMRFFSDELINKCCVLKKQSIDPSQGKYYLGVDIARMGHDYSSFQIIKKIDRNMYHHIWNETTSKTYTTETHDKIIALSRKYNVKKAGIDAGSGTLGVGILDFLNRDSFMASRVVPLNNKARDLDREGERKASLLKEDMYQNLLGMMEQGRLLLLDDDDVKESLRSVQYDVEVKPNHKTVQYVFSHINSDIVEALIRAAVLANEDKSLNLFVTSSKSIKTW